jgi:Transposase DDE domain
MSDCGAGVAADERLQEDWALVQDLLPVGWQDKARELGALRRTRGIADAGTLLRVLFIHLAQGCGLRTTAALACEGGLADLSDVAILKRLKGCADWFEWMAQGLRAKWLPEFPALNAAWAGRRIRLVDGTMVSEPGETGSKWRLHYSVGLPTLHCDEVIVTTQKQGETLKRFAVRPGDVLIADRGYAQAGGISHVCAHQGDVIIRTNLVTLPLHDRQGARLDPLKWLRRLQVGQCGDWPVWIKTDKRLIAGRLCAIKKGQAAAQKARQRVLRESQRNGTQVRPETLEAADYVFVFTTLPPALNAKTVMELYRGRWQIELAFKRLKSLVQLGHLKKHDSQASRAWLQGKLLVALLLDALLQTAERISPWGYYAGKIQSNPLPVARNPVYA